MQPVQIVIRDMPKSAALQTHIKEKAEKLLHYANHIHSVRVVIELPQKHKRHGKLFRVRIDMVVPGKQLVVNHHLNEDVYVAIRDAFKALLRRLEDHSSIRRGDVKTHEAANYGYISKVFSEEQYGFIQGMDGNEYYFNTMNIANFDKLEIGDMVQFLGGFNGEGRQAHHISREKKSSYYEELD